MSLRDSILHNFWLKLLSLVLAIMTWFTIFAIQRNVRLNETGGTGTRTFNNHLITVMKSAADVHGFRVVPNAVNVTVTGANRILSTLSPKDVDVFINLTDAELTEGLTRKVQVFLPDGVDLVNVTPPFVRIVRLPEGPGTPAP
jgi:YbbR domain-containing protein